MFKNLKTCVVFLLVIVSFLIINTQNANAWRIATHYLIMEKVRLKFMEYYQNTERKNIPDIAEALYKYPDYAAWGSDGPDLSVAYHAFYLLTNSKTPGTLWQDRTHYDRVGTLATKLMKKALATKDEQLRLKRVAFAAGWITHIAGDLLCHDKYVTPYCGIYLKNPETRDKHSSLEVAADSILWKKEKEKEKEKELTKDILFDNNYFSDIRGQISITANDSYLEPLECDFLKEISSFLAEVINETFSTTIDPKYQNDTYLSIYPGGLMTEYMIKQWFLASRYLSYFNIDLPLIPKLINFYTYDDAIKIVPEGSDCEKKMLNAFQASWSYSIDILENIIKNSKNDKYELLTDNLTIDTGYKERTYGEFVITIKYGENLFNPNDNTTVFFVILDNKTKDGIKKRLILDHNRYWDMLPSRMTDYYWFIDDDDIDDKDFIKYPIKTMGIELKDEILPNDNITQIPIKQVKVRINGLLKYEKHFIKTSKDPNDVIQVLNCNKQFWKVDTNTQTFNLKNLSLKIERKNSSVLPKTAPVDNKSGMNNLTISLVNGKKTDISPRYEGSFILSLTLIGEFGNKITLDNIDNKYAISRDFLFPDKSIQRTYNLKKYNFNNFGDLSKIIIKAIDLPPYDRLKKFFGIWVLDKLEISINNIIVFSSDDIFDSIRPYKKIGDLENCESNFNIEIKPQTNEFYKPL